MEKQRISKIIVSSVLVLALVITGLSLLLVNGGDDENVQSERVLGTDISNVPYITSVPQVSVYEGELFSYDVRYSDNDSGRENISLSYVSGPKWLAVSDMRVVGVAPVGAVGEYKYVIRISDGVNSSTQSNYILVLKDEK